MEYIQKCPVYNDQGGELVKWVATWTGQCFYTDGDALATISSVSGYVSFVCWLGAQLPQVVVNYMNHSVEGLSWGFLLNWFAGDFTNFMGCLLTGQMAFQTVLGGYYIFIDVILGSQYLYYSRLDKKRHERHRQIYYDNAVLNQTLGADDYKDMQPVNVPHNNRGESTSSSNKLLSASFIASFAKLASSAPVVMTQEPALAASTSSSLIADVGRVFAWVCTFMYLTSRIPQIIKNYQRKSTWGTSMLLFLSALTGNITYTISILCSPQARGAERHVFLMNELPYLIGSAGTVIFDLTIFAQFWYFGNKQTHPDSPVLEVDEDYYYDDHPHHQYPDSSLIPAFEHQHHDNTIKKKGKGVDDGGVDSSTPLAMSYQTNYNSL